MKIGRATNQLELFGQGIEGEKNDADHVVLGAVADGSGQVRAKSPTAGIESRGQRKDMIEISGGLILVVGLVVDVIHGNDGLLDAPPLREIIGIAHQCEIAAVEGTELIPRRGGIDAHET